MAIRGVRRSLLGYKHRLGSLFPVQFGYELLGLLHRAEVVFYRVDTVSKGIEVVVDQKLAHERLRFLGRGPLFAAKNLRLRFVFPENEDFPSVFRVANDLFLLTLHFLLLMQSDFVQVDRKSTFDPTVLA